MSPICGKISEFFHDTPHIHWGKLSEVISSINSIETFNEARYVLGYLETLSKTHPLVFILFLQRIAPSIENRFGKEIIALVAISKITGKSERDRNAILIALGFNFGDSLQGIEDRYPRESREVDNLVQLVGRLSTITTERIGRNVLNRIEPIAGLAA